jgi:hypothetical protein
LAGLLAPKVASEEHRRAKAIRCFFMINSLFF